MDAINKLIIIVVAVSAIGVISACAGASSSEYSQFSEHQKVLEQCLADLDSSVRSSLGTPPHFENLRQTVRWTLKHLSPDIHAALIRAGHSAIIEARPESLSILAENKSKFRRLLHRVTAKELGQIVNYRRDGCDIVVPQKLSNVIDLDLNLSHGYMHKSFESIGLTDSYEIERAFLLMLTLEASGTKWDEWWLSN